jgi:hypothetical protein
MTRVDCHQKLPVQAMDARPAAHIAAVADPLERGCDVASRNAPAPSASDRARCARGAEAFLIRDALPTRSRVLPLAQVTTTFGRFVLQEEEGRVCLRPRTADNAPLLRAVALACFALVVLFPAVAFASVPTIALSFGLAMFLMVSGVPMASYRGVALSRFGRVRRSVEARRKVSGGAAEDAFRTAANALTLTVDGRTFTPRDFLGVVMVMSTEWAETLGKYDKKVLRFRPTLMMRDVAFELDVFEGADEVDGLALANAVGSAIAGQPIKAARVEWHPLPYRRPMALVGLQVVEVFLLVGALLVALALTRTHSAHLWVVSAILLVILVVDVGSTRAAAHSLARERSAAASKLLSEARATLGHD